MPLIQNSIVQKFMKRIIGENSTISSNFRQDFNKVLTIFILYTTTLANEITNKRGAKIVTIEDYAMALKQANF
jgi:histone H3/H4